MDSLFRQLGPGERSVIESWEFTVAWACCKGRHGAMEVLERGLYRTVMKTRFGFERIVLRALRRL